MIAAVEKIINSSLDLNNHISSTDWKRLQNSYHCNKTRKSLADVFGGKQIQDAAFDEFCVYMGLYGVALRVGRIHDHALSISDAISFLPNDLGDGVYDAWLIGLGIKLKYGVKDDSAVVFFRVLKIVHKYHAISDWADDMQRLHTALLAIISGINDVDKQRPINWLSSKTVLELFDRIVQGDGRLAISYHLSENEKKCFCQNAMRVF